MSGGSFVFVGLVWAWGALWGHREQVVGWWDGWDDLCFVKVLGHDVRKGGKVGAYIASWLGELGLEIPTVMIPDGCDEVFFSCEFVVQKFCVGLLF